MVHSQNKSEVNSLTFAQVVIYSALAGLRTVDVTPCLAIWDKLWFVNMGYSNEMLLIDSRFAKYSILYLYYILR